MPDHDPGMNQRQRIIVAPVKKTNSFKYLLPGSENSSVMISVVAMYRKVPAAKLEKMIVISVPSFSRSIPRTMPIGVAILKMKTSHLTSLKSLGKVFTSAIPRELPAALLWMAIARTMFRTWIRFICKPHASPSKQLCTERAIMRIKGVQLQPFLLFGTLWSSVRAALEAFTV